jgi:hypothetical protein
MNKRFRHLSILILIFLAIGSFSVFVVVNAQDDGDPDEPQLQLAADEDPNQAPEVFIPEKFRPQRSSQTVDDDLVDVVYFATLDSVDHNTIMFLYNTGVMTGTAEFNFYRQDGALWITQTLTVPPLHFLRISADFITIGSPPSWNDTVVISFGDNSAYGRLAITEGIKMEGWIAWTNTETYDPRTSVDMMPLRLSSDPASVFLPTIEH